MGQRVVTQTGEALVVLSLLDQEGTVVGWVVPPDGGRGVDGVKMVLMDKRDVLAK